MFQNELIRNTLMQQYQDTLSIYWSLSPLSQSLVFENRSLFSKQLGINCTYELIILKIQNFLKKDLFTSTINP